MRRFILALCLLFAGAAHAQAPIAAFPVTPPRVPQIIRTMDFTASLPSGLTYTRANTIWTYNAAGAITSYAADAPPIPSYRNAGTLNSGIALMPARTNFCLNSTAPATQTRTGLSGSYVFQIGPHDTGSVTLSGAASGTVTAGNPVGVSGLSSASVTATVSGSVSYLGCERQSVIAVTNFAATEPIVTAGASVARSVETLTGSVSGLGFSTQQGTFIVSGEIQAASSSNQYIVALDDGTANNLIALMYAPGTGRLQAQYMVGGSVVANAAITPSGFPLRFVAAISWNSGTIKAAINGTTVEASTSINASTFTTFRVGNNAASAFSCVCFISRIEAYDFDMTDAQLTNATVAGTANFARDLSFLVGIGQSDEWASYASPVATSEYSSPTWQATSLGGTHLWKLNWPITVSGFAGINPIVPYTNFTDISAAYHYELPVGSTGTTICSGTFGTIDYSCGQSALFAMGAQLRSLGTGKDYLLLGAAAPGHKCGELGPVTTGSSSPYNYALSSIRRAASQNRASGGTPKIRGVMVNQGQTDAAEGTSYSDFLSCWTTLITQTATDYKAATTQTDTPIFFFTGLNTDGSGDAAQGFPMQRAFYDMTVGSSPVSNARMCVPAYLFPLNTAHGPHYTSAGQDLQGEYRAQCYYKEFFGGGNWKPLYPTSISASGTTVTVNMNVPVGSLTIDGSTLPQGPAPFLGFWYIDDSNNKITGASVSGSTVTLTLSGSTNASGRRLRAAYNGPVIANDSLLPTVASGGTGGTPGACVVTVQIDTGNVANTFTAPYGYFQAKYNVTVNGSGAISAVNSVAGYGGYPNGDQGGLASKANTYNAVPVIGCGLSGATLDSVRLRQGFASNSYAGAWTSLRDSSTATSRTTGLPLYNWLIPFDISF